MGSPAGVKIISVLYYIGAFVGLIAGISIFGMGTVFLKFFGIEGMAFSGLFVIMALFVIVMSILYFFVAKDLWKCKQWARYAAIIIGIMNISWELVLLFVKAGGFSIIGITINLIIVIYLFVDKNVKECFS